MKNPSTIRESAELLCPVFSMIGKSKKGPAMAGPERFYPVEAWIRD